MGALVVITREQHTERMCVRCRAPWDASERTVTDTFRDRDGITRTLTAHVPSDRCSTCGVHANRHVNTYPRNRKIGGKRGKNSGKVRTQG